MTPSSVIKQINNIYLRMVGSGLSAKQNHCAVRGMLGGGTSIGDLRSASLSLGHIAYEVVYEELEQNDAYHIKIPDGSLLWFQYRFDGNEKLMRHRLAFFPSVDLPMYDEAPWLYEHEELFGDIAIKQIVRFPIRVDFDPLAHKDVLHPQCHVTFGQYEGCRIPVSGPIMPNTFLMFVLRNFYSRAYMKNKNKFDKKMSSVPMITTLTKAEKKISYFVMN